MTLRHKRVVITGMGTVNCTGSTVEESWTNVVAGRLALDQAALTITEDSADEVGCIFGTGTGGQYRLTTGMYDELTGQRLTLPDGQDAIEMTTGVSVLHNRNF